MGNISQNIYKKVLNFSSGIPKFRELALDHGSKKLYNYFITRNPENLPLKVQYMRYQALNNLLHTINLAFSDGRFSERVRHRLVSNFVGNVITGSRKRQTPFQQTFGYYPPTFLTISPTKKCNLTCKGCYANSSKKNDNTLDFNIFQRILDEKREKWGSHFNVISGGEPLMYSSLGKDLFDILNMNRQDYFMMYTNGTLITRDIAKKMADAGNITPAISVEGWENETDARRGKGVFKKIQQAIENLLSEGVPFGISITATRQNAETILSDDFIEYYFAQQGAIYGWIFQYMPIGRCYTIDMMVTPEQRLRMLTRQIDLLYNRNLFLIDFWNGGPMSAGCIAAGRSGGYFYIDWDGNIAPCVFFPYYISNIYNLYADGRDLTSILESQYFKAIRNWQNLYVNRGLDKRCNGKKVHNLFMPCPIRDHYAFARKAILVHDAVPMDKDAAKALIDVDYRKRMMEYDSKLQTLLDPMWDEGFSTPAVQSQDTVSETDL